MNFSAEFLSDYLIWTSNIIYAALLIAALLKAPWHHLRNNKDLHVLLGSCLILWLVWHNSAGVTPGMEFHLLLVTTITLMFGWPFAILVVSIAQLGLSLEGQADWITYALNTICNGIIPIGITYGLYWLVYLWLPRNFFIYIFLIAFAGGALSMLLSRLSGLAILTTTGVDLGDEPLFIVVMLFPEAFINGFVMTLLVVYRPKWVSSFSDKSYLYNN
jgi:uncharacterized membrane protein